MTSQSQVNKVYSEVIADNGGASQTRAQKVYAEVIARTSIVATSRVAKVYLEVIADLAGAPASAANPVICICT